MADLYVGKVSVDSSRVDMACAGLVRPSPIPPTWRVSAAQSTGQASLNQLAHMREFFAVGLPRPLLIVMIDEGQVEQAGKTHVHVVVFDLDHGDVAAVALVPGVHVVEQLPTSVLELWTAARGGCFGLGGFCCRLCGGASLLGAGSTGRRRREPARARLPARARVWRGRGRCCEGLVFGGSVAGAAGDDVGLAHRAATVRLMALQSRRAMMAPAAGAGCCAESNPCAVCQEEYRIATCHIDL